MKILRRRAILLGLQSFVKGKWIEKFRFAVLRRKPGFSASKYAGCGRQDLEEENPERGRKHSR